MSKKAFVNAITSLQFWVFYFLEVRTESLNGPHWKRTETEHEAGSAIHSPGTRHPTSGVVSMVVSFRHVSPTTTPTCVSIAPSSSNNRGYTTCSPVITALDLLLLRSQNSRKILNFPNVVVPSTDSVHINTVHDEVTKKINELSCQLFRLVSYSRKQVNNNEVCRGTTCCGRWPCFGILCERLQRTRCLRLDPMRMLPQLDWRGLQ